MDRAHGSSGNAEIWSAVVTENAKVSGHAKVCYKAVAMGEAVIEGKANVGYGMVIGGKVHVGGDVEICPNGRIFVLYGELSITTFDDVLNLNYPITNKCKMFIRNEDDFYLRKHSNYKY